MAVSEVLETINQETERKMSGYGDATGSFCLSPRIRSSRTEMELEMGPIRSVSCAQFSADTSPFTPAESEFLNRVIQVSPANAEDRRSGEGK